MALLQIVYRMLVNVDALNMVESVGNVTRRRTVPVIVPKAPGSYVIRWVPAVSGEALAHRYQWEVVELASGRYKGCSGRVDYWSGQGEFLKHWDLGFYKRQCDRAVRGEAPKPQDWECSLADLLVECRGTNCGLKGDVRHPEKSSVYLTRRQGNQVRLTIEGVKYVEEVIVGNSIVEDIGGFLVTQGPVRRTSRIRFSYLIPTLDAMEATQLDHQLQVRGALKAESLGIAEGVQVPYYVQVGSVLYGGNIELDVGGVGCYSIGGGCVDDQECPVEARRCIAVEALRPVLEGDFGAKRSRYRPHNVLEVAVAVVSDKPVPLPPATLPLTSLLDELAAKLRVYREKLGVKYSVVAYATMALGEEYGGKLRGMLKEKLGVESVSTIPEFIEQVLGVLQLDCGRYRSG